MSDQDIYKICQKYNIQKYTINSDGSISVDGNVYMSFKSLREIPLVFKEVSGHFSCSDNQLKSLEGCPEKVGGGFYCEDNNLSSLKGCPKEVGGGFDCSFNQLTSLEGCPDARIIRCYNNKITSFKGIPEFWEGELDIENNPVDEIFKLFNRDVRCIEWIREYDVIQGDKVSRHRLEEVFHTLNMKIDEEIHLINYLMIK